MRLFFLFAFTSVLLIALFMLSGCSDDTTSPPVPQDELLVTTTIGPEGGNVEADDLTLSIPAGSFAEDHDVSVYKLAEELPLGDSSASESFGISGLPRDYQGPLGVSLKYSGELSASSFIVTGVPTPMFASEDSSVVYAFHEATESASSLVGQVPAPEDDSRTNKAMGQPIGDPFRIIISTLTGYTEHETAHFKFRYPLALAPKMPEVEADFESALGIIEDDLGFAFWPGVFKLKVGVVDQEQPQSINYQTSNNVFVLSWDAVSDREVDTRTAGSGMLFLRMFLAHSLPKTPSQNPWLSYAVNTWADEVFADGAGFSFPATFPSNAMAPFSGIHAGLGNSPSEQQIKNHGYGMSSVINYLVDAGKIDKADIGSMYQVFADGGHQVNALLNSVDDPVDDWWPDFFEAYVGGSIYGRTWSHFESDITEAWFIRSAEDTLKVFAASDAGIGSYRDLSAKTFLINLNYSELTEDHSLTLSSSAPSGTENVAMVIFGVHDNGHRQLLGTARNQNFTIPNLKGYVDALTRKFLVVMVNSEITSLDYYGAYDINLTATVDLRDDSILDSTRCWVHATVVGDMHTDYFDGSESDETRNQEVMAIVSAVGGFTDLTFTGSYATLGTQGTVTVTLNEALDTVVSVSYQQHRDDGSRTEGLTGTDIPLTSDVFHRFTRSESDACSSLINVNFQTVSPGATVTLQDFNCDATSEVFVEFYE